MMSTQPAPPKVSIGMPVYNGEDYLVEALGSVLAQDYENLEILISDNASTDRTGEICQDHAAKDPRITYHRFAENQGAAANYNHTVAMASGDLFKWMAHDDLIHPTFVRRCVEVYLDELTHGAQPAIVYPGGEKIDAAGDVIGTDFDRMHTRAGWPAARLFSALQEMSSAAPIFGIMPREKLAKTRLIGSFPASDYVFMAESAIQGPIIRFPEMLFQRRIHQKMSRQANVSKADVLKWFDPKARAGRLTMRQRLFQEYMRSASGAQDVSWGGRLACCAAVLTSVPTKRLRVFLGGIKENVFGIARKQRA